MPHDGQAAVSIRTARPEDAEVCGRICYDAFSTISGAHGFPCDLPSSEVSVGLLSQLFAATDSFYCVVAESDGQILGSNVLDERSVIRGIGPITVDPKTQNTGVGRKLMQAVIDRAQGSGAPGVRLVQAAFHNRSLSLYASLGFVVREPLACVQGTSRDRSGAGAVRTASAADLEACNELSRRVHGFDRSIELAQAIGRGSARVVERGGRITGYATDLAFFSHATAETNPDMQALIASAEGFGGPGILVPSRNSALLSWCLANGLRVVQPMTLMTMGLYSEPAGTWLPSVSF